MRVLLCLLLLLRLFRSCSADQVEELVRASSAEPPADISFVPDSRNGLLGSFLEGFDDFGNASNSALVARQKCPYPVMCSPETCCPAETKCCIAVPPLCCPLTSRCKFGGSACCPDFAQTCGGKFCAEPEATCCGGSICPPGTLCNTNGGVSCCKAGESLCLGGCCPEGYECATRAGYCRKRSATTSKKPTATEKPCPTGVVRRGSEHDVDLQKRENLKPDCEYECHNGKRIPVITIENIPGETDQLFLSMCSGIRNTGRSRGGDRDSDVLTYKGPNGKNKRRGAGGTCKGYCAGQAVVFSDPTRLECDEYPPAMAGEGGKGAHRLCIPAPQNQAQARIFRRFVTLCKPKNNDKFKIRMKGGCKTRNGERDNNKDTTAEFVKRQSSSTFAASSDQLHAFSNLSYTAVALRNLKNGHYSLDVQFDGDVQNTLVLDNDGEAYYVSEATSNGENIEFDVTGLDDDYPLPAALFVDTPRALHLSYSATVTPPSTSTSTSTSAGTEMPTTTSSGIVGRQTSWGSSVLILYVIMWVL